MRRGSISFFTRVFQRSKDSRGQTLVEFALVLPILLTLLLGIIEFGWVFFNHLQVVHAARDAVRFASVEPTKVDAEIQQRTEDTVTGFVVSKKDSRDEFNADPERRQLWVLVTPDGKDVTVAMKAAIPLLTPFFSLVLEETEHGESDVFITATKAVMRVE